MNFLISLGFSGKSAPFTTTQKPPRISLAPSRKILKSPSTPVRRNKPGASSPEPAKLPDDNYSDPEGYRQGVALQFGVPVSCLVLTSELGQFPNNVGMVVNPGSRRRFMGNWLAHTYLWCRSIVGAQVAFIVRLDAPGNLIVNHA